MFSVGKMQGAGVVGTLNPACCFSTTTASGTVSNVRSIPSYGLMFGFCKGSLKGCPLVLTHRGRPIYGAVFNTGKRNLCARADANQEKISSRIAPLELESPTGQFLSQILKSHPHLLPAAIDQQLERLAADRDAEAQQEQPSTSSTDLVLYRRIAELKAEERRKALEEIIYALIVQKFMDAGVSLIPTISLSVAGSGKVDTWPNQDTELEAVHSIEAVEMIKEHLSLVLGNRNAVSDSNTVAEISKLRVGQVYAASVMYGYFLRRVDKHFQLEKSMKTLPFFSNEEADAEQLNYTHPELEGGNWQDNSAVQGGAAIAAAVAAMAGAAAPEGQDFNNSQPPSV